jgi:hypothetical protein
MSRKRWASLFGAAAVLAAVVAALVISPWAGSASRARSDLENELDLSSEPADMVAHYRYIESHRGMAEQIPCYCGCGKAIGHRNLFDCFVISRGKYSDHASGCMVCTNEATDVERLALEGKSAREIRSWIDGEYSRYGPPTNTP